MLLHALRGITLGSVLLACNYTPAFAQLGIGTKSPDSSAILDISSTKQGLLPPRMTTTQRDAINGGKVAEGLVIYNTDDKCLQHWNGLGWKCSGDGDNSKTTYSQGFSSCDGLKDVKYISDSYTSGLSFILGGNNLIYNAFGGFYTAQIDPETHDANLIYGSQYPQPIHSITETLPDLKWKKIEAFYSSGTHWRLFLLSEDGRIFALEYFSVWKDTDNLSNTRGMPHSILKATYKNQITPLEIKAKDENNNDIVWEQMILNVERDAIYAYGNGKWYSWGNDYLIGSKYPLVKSTRLHYLGVEEKTGVFPFKLLNINEDKVGKAIGKEEALYVKDQTYFWIDGNGKININDETYCTKKNLNCYESTPTTQTFYLDKYQRQLSFPSTNIKAVKLETNGGYGFSGTVNHQELHVLGSDNKAYVYSPGRNNPLPDVNNKLRSSSLPDNLKIVDIVIAKDHTESYFGTFALTDTGDLYHYFDNNNNENNYYVNLTKYLKLPKLDKILHVYKSKFVVVRSKETGHTIQISQHSDYLHSNLTRGIYFDDSMVIRRAGDSFFDALDSSGKKTIRYYWGVLWHCLDNAFIGKEKN